MKLTVGQAETLEILIQNHGNDPFDFEETYNNGTNFANGMALAIRTLKRKDLIKQTKTGKMKVSPKAESALQTWKEEWKEEIYPWQQIMEAERV